MQLILVFMVLGLPWFLGPNQGGRAFGYPTIAICAWGVWRFVIYDWLTWNDVPAMGYFVVAPMYGSVALIVYVFRFAIRWIYRCLFPRHDAIDDEPPKV
jgi:hypothetical protein